MACVAWRHPRATARSRQRVLHAVDEAVLHLARTPHALCAAQLNALVHTVGSGENLCNDTRHGILLLYVHVLFACQHQCLCSQPHGSAACSIMLSACLQCLERVEHAEFSLFVLAVRLLRIIFDTKLHHTQPVPELRALLLHAHEHFAFHLASDPHTSAAVDFLLDFHTCAPTSSP